MDIECECIDGSKNLFTVSIMHGTANLQIMVTGRMNDSPRYYDIIPMDKGCQKCRHPNQSATLEDGCSTCYGWNDLSRVVAMGEYLKGGDLPLSEDIYHGKYRRSEIYIQSVGLALGFYVKNLQSDILDFDIVIPKPWHGASGNTFQHEEILVKCFCQVIAKDYRTDILHAKMPGKMVKMPDLSERHTLAHKKYQAYDMDLKGARVLLVDDILTSGSTLSRCASELVRIGASEVIGIVAARSSGK